MTNHKYNKHERIGLINDASQPIKLYKIRKKLKTKEQMNGMDRIDIMNRKQ